MLAALYIVRADVSITVRQAALSVWKAVVANTPRVLLEIIGVLVKQLIAKLASSIEVSSLSSSFSPLSPHFPTLLFCPIHITSNLISQDLRVVAGRSLGELVRKLGDRVLPTVVPLLQAQLTTTTGAGEGDEAEAMRQGVCLGLVEILAAASKTQVETYIGTLVPALQTALCDGSEEVRALAAKGFNTLFKNIGPR